MLNYILLCTFIISNLAYGQKITAHRGASFDAPENTMPAFKLAWQKNADFIEGDFFLTKDNKVVCIHDSKTDKLADKKLNVENSNWDQLKTLDVGSRKGKSFRGTRIPLLDDILKTIPQGKGIFIEIKSKKLAIVKHIKALIEQTELKNHQIHFISFHQSIIRECKALMPDVKTQLLLSIKEKKGKLNYDVDQLIQLAKSLKADGLGTSFNEKLITAENVRKLQAAGLYWNVWTINDLKRAKMLKAVSIDYITTDRPKFISAALN